MSNRRKSSAEKVIRMYGLGRCENPECASWLLALTDDGEVVCFDCQTPQAQKIS